MIYQNVRFYQTCSPSRDGTFLKDYREESFHKPMFAAPTSATENIPSFGNPNYEFENLTPRKGHEFDEMEIPVSFDLMDPKTNPLAPTFLIIRNGDADNPIVWLAGWIDEAEPVATKGPSTNTRIHWHIDHWMSLVFKDYLGRRRVYPNTDSFLTFGPGRFKRGAESLKRPEPSEPRKWIVEDVSPLFGITSNDPWFILARSSGQPSHIDILFWKNATSVTIQGTTYYGMSTASSFKGYYDEYLGIDPDSIIGVWASPLPPFRTDSASGVSYIHGATYFAYAIPTNEYNPTIHTQDLRDENGDGITVDDNTLLQFVDPTGAIYASVPWGYTVNEIEAFVDIGSAGANLILSCNTPPDPATHGENFISSSVEGLVCTIPLPAIPITSNATSSYYYSGEREYDQTIRTIQRKESAVQGIAGSAGSAMGGAIAGAMIGGPGGAVAGGLVGLGMSVISTSGSAIIGQEYDKKTQQAVDKLKSNQASNVMNMTGGFAWVSAGGKKWCMVKSKRDPTSSAELAAEHQELGYITDCYAASCDTLIRQGGGMRIEGLEVQGWGSRDRHARDYISAVFARGVHIDII